MGIKVIVAGFRGRMGSAAVNMVKEDEDLILSALLDPFAKDTEVDGVPVFTDKSQLIGFDADVWIDFTTPAVAYDNTRFALEHGFAPVVGTTGFTEDEIVELIALSEAIHQFFYCLRLIAHGLIFTVKHKMIHCYSPKQFFFSKLF